MFQMFGAVFAADSGELKNAIVTFLQTFSNLGKVHLKHPEILL